MKQLLTILLALTPIFFFAQDWEFEKPDYTAIEKAVSIEDSTLFYSKLMKRFAAGDPEMTLEEGRHLYYGYTFQDEYSPYGISEFSDSLQKIVKKESLSDADHDDLVRFGDEVLKQFPFDLRVMNYQLYALDLAKKTEAYKLKLWQMNFIYEVLLSSGNGLTKEDAFYVINTSNEYDLIPYLGLRFGGRQELIEHYDYLTIAENEVGVEGLFFDVTPCLLSLKNMMK